MGPTALVTVSASSSSAHPADVFAGYTSTTIVWFENLLGSPVTFAQHTLTAALPTGAVWQLDYGDLNKDGHTGAWRPPLCQWSPAVTVC